MTQKEIPHLKAAWDRAAFPPKGWSGDQYFMTRHHHAIRYAHAPAEGEPRGTIVLTHGYGENIDLYYETIKEYQKQGFAVWAMDWHGHGKSGRRDLAAPRRPHAHDLRAAREDLHDFVTKIVPRDHAKPLVLSTHSMGGHISMMYLQKYRDTFDGAVMSAPFLDLYKGKLPAIAVPLVRAAFRLAGWLGMGDWSLPDYGALARRFNAMAFGLPLLPETVAKTTARNEYSDEIRRMQQGEEVDHPTPDWISATFATTDHMMKPANLARVRTPVLIGSATGDRLVDNGAHARAAALLPQARHVTIDSAQHGLWFEDNQKYGAWMGHISRFLDDIVADRAGRRAPSPARPGEPSSWTGHENIHAGSYESVHGGTGRKGTGLMADPAPLAA